MLLGLFCLVLLQLPTKFHVLGNMEGYLRIASKLKLGTLGDEYAAKSRDTVDKDVAGSSKTGWPILLLP